MSIPYGRQAIDADDVAAVVKVLEGDWLTQGPSVRQLEEQVASACAVPYAVAFSSGTAALHAAAFCAGIGPGDDLLTSAITFVASANCGAYLGATPIFADIDLRTFNMSADTVAAALSRQTRLVVVVHMAGLPAPVAEIRDRVGEEVLLVEDASHALGAAVDGEPVGSCRHSDMTVFSFHPVKAIAAGEGGMVTTRRADLYERLRRFRNHGIVRDEALLSSTTEGGWHQEQIELGFNYRLSDIHAALASSQLKKLERFVERRNEIADRYRELLIEVDSLILPPQGDGGTHHAYHLFIVRHRDGADGRRRLYDGLRARQVLAQVHYLPVYRQPWYRRTFGYSRGMCPSAEAYYESCLSLPCYPALTADQQDAVVEAVAEFC